MKLKTSDLTATALDWTVAKCEAGKPVGSFLDGVVPHPSYNNFHPSTIWSQGGPIIERERISISTEENGWSANICAPRYGLSLGFGPTPLIAAMRCFVASRLGDEVDIPEELL